MVENSETSSRERRDQLHYTCTQDSTQTKGEVSIRSELNKRTFALQNNEKNPEVLPS